MGEEADADWQDGLIEWGREDTLNNLITRREYIRRNVPTCFVCNSTQVQLIAHHEPAQWRCRSCKHRFNYEP